MLWKILRLDFIWNSHPTSTYTTLQKACAVTQFTDTVCSRWTNYSHWSISYLNRLSDWSSMYCELLSSTPADACFGGEFGIPKMVAESCSVELIDIGSLSMHYRPVNKPASSGKIWTCTQVWWVRDLRKSEGWTNGQNTEPGKYVLSWNMLCRQTASNDELFIKVYNACGKCFNSYFLVSPLPTFIMSPTWLCVSGKATLIGARGLTCVTYLKHWVSMARNVGQPAAWSAGSKNKVSKWRFDSIRSWTIWVPLLFTWEWRINPSRQAVEVWTLREHIYATRVVYRFSGLDTGLIR